MKVFSSVQRRVLTTAAVLGILVASLVLTGSAAAEGAPFGTVPGYPLETCGGVVTAGTGMWNGTGTINIDVPGPVVDAFLWWAGADWGGADQLTVNGATVTGTLIDATATIHVHPAWLLWRADIEGQVSQGLNTLAIAGWEELAPDWSWRNGATLVVVYEGDPTCTDPVAIQLYEGLDWFYYNTMTEWASETQVYSFEAAPFDRAVAMTFSYAGADHESAVCRDGTIWSATGTGPPPAQLLNKQWPTTVGVNGGELIAVAALDPSPPCTVQLLGPTVALEGGYLGAEWSVATIHGVLPAGAEWIAFQMESVAFFNGVVVEGESGAWVGNVLSFPLPTPDMTVSKDDGETNVEPGDTLTYDITYSNIGDRYGHDVVIVDTIPDRTSFVSCYTPFGTCTEANGVVSFELGTVNAGDGGLVQVTVELDPIYPCGDTPITNSVSISTSTLGDDLSNNQAEDTDIVTAYVEVDVEKSAAPEPVQAGDPLAYTLDWTVEGNCWAENTTITDNLPADTTYVGCAPAGVCSESGGVITWSLGTITPNDTGSVSLDVNVNTCLPNGHLIENTAVITEDFGDSDQDTIISTVAADHVLSIDKTGDPKPALKNEALVYSIDWEITGNEPANNVIITDSVPDGTAFDSATGGGVHDPATGIIAWNLGDFCPPASGSVSFTVIVDRYTVDPAEVSNTATICDDDPGTACAEDQDIAPVRFTSEIGDLVWFDLNANAVQDAGEDGMPDVLVNLYDAGADGLCATADDALLDTRTTDAAGAYLFDLLYEGDYCVAVDETTIAPDHFRTPSMPNPHGPITLDPDSDPDEQYMDADFGYYPGGSIGDYVWLDLDGDAIQDASEVGIPNVVLNLYEAGTDGTCGTADDMLVDSVTTDANGEYIFYPLPIETYCVDVDESTVPADHFLSDGIAEPHGPIALGPGEDYLTADFGYYPGGSIGDYVWLDLNGDAVQDAGETGIAGAVVNLYEAGADGACGTADDVLKDSATTAADGSYLFDPLPMRVYCASVDESTLPADVFLSPGSANPHGPIDLGPGEDYLTADFAYYPGGSMGDYVWFDADRDGVQDADEDGIAGLTVTLYDAGADGVCDPAADVALDSAVTDAAGMYVFDPLPIGTYCVHVTGTAVGLNPSTGTTNPLGPISLGAWMDYLTADFGFAYPDIVITKSVDKEWVHRFEDLTFTIVVTNEGPGPADGVVVTDAISEYLEYMRLDVTKGSGSWNSGTSTFTVEIGWMDEGEEVTVTITGRAIDVPTSELDKTISNVAFVDFTGDPGPVPSNETITELTYFAPDEIPEPSTMALMGSGLLSLVGYAQLRRRRRREE